MSPNYKMRQIRIRRVQEQNTPRAVARLVRDLKALQRAKGPLNQAERSAFRNLRQRLVEEWVVVTGEKAKQVDAKIDDLLNTYHASAENDEP